MKFPIFGGSDDAPNSTAVRYAYLGNTDLTDWVSSEPNRQIPLSEDLTITDLKVMVDTAPGAGKSRTFTVRKNGADTGVTCTISDTNTSAVFSGSVSFTAGDLICLSSTPSGTPTAPGNIFWWLFASTTGSKFLIMGGTDSNFSATADNFTNPFGSSSSITSATNQDVVVPTGGSITKAAVAVSVAPGTGKSYAVSMRVNNTTDALTTTVADTNTSATATGSQALSAGNSITIKCHPSGTPASTRIAWCFTFVPTTDGEAFFGYGAGTPLATSGATYEQPLGVGAVQPTTESLAYLKLPACTIKSMYVRIPTAPGVGATRTFTWRDNAADSALTVTISGTNLTGNDTTHSVVHTADQTVGIASTVSLVPAPAACSGMHIGYVILSNIRSGSATLTAATAVTGTEKTARSGTGTISAATAVTGTEKTARSGSGTLTAATAVTGTERTTRSGTGSLTAASTVTGTLTTNHRGTSTLTASTAVSSTGRGARSGTSALTVTSAVTSAASTTRSGVGSSTAASALTGTGQKDQASTSAISASTALSASGTAERSGTSTVAASATATAATGTANRTGEGVIGATPIVTGDGAPIVIGQGIISAVSAVTATGSTHRAGNSTIVIVTAASGSGRSGRFGHASLNSTTNLTGAGLKHVLSSLRPKKLVGSVASPALAGSTASALSGAIGSTTLSGTVED
jgi:hypothetical protein